MSNQAAFHDEKKKLFTKFESKYWTTKQRFMEKLGHEQDTFIVSCDSVLDARLMWFEHNDSSLLELIKALKSYIGRFDALSLVYEKMFEFFKHFANKEANKAGKMMTAISNALIVYSMEKDILQNPFTKMLKDLETFYNHAISDCRLSIHNMEIARTQYRAAMLWIADISKELDPEIYKKMSKYRTAQINVKKVRTNFNKMKNDIIEKICILSTSRTTMLTQTAINQHNCLHSMHCRRREHFEQIINYYSKPVSYRFETLKNILGPNNGVYDSDDDEFLIDNSVSSININEKNSDNTKEDSNKENTPEPNIETMNLIEFSQNDSLDSDSQHELHTRPNSLVKTVSNKISTIPSQIDEQYQRDDELLYENIINGFSRENDKHKDDLHGIDWNKYLVNNECSLETDQIEKNENNNILDDSSKLSNRKSIEIESDKLFETKERAFKKIMGDLDSNDWKKFFSDINPIKPRNSSDQC